ncbi:YggT family protein [Octadecabacter sp. 1_MG-2023]|uniref:YggT family protein n=1 Tax=unclassified Octadecabacter TaxID=196158 RepID=UPI001C0A2AA5|nr:MULTISPECIES: YggT family protein [unclassified Octadecabacter]MBU2992434.1 YggT family protein [Octadecabacter sp. B2R22]MDO6734809.1 YggT family protein [Octadecabacter sp. 1_MG-2023]
MVSIIQILLMVVGVLRMFIIAHFIMSWLIQFQVLNIRQQFVAQIWYGLSRLLEPIYGPIRRILPQMGGIDLSPLVALLGLEAVRIVLTNQLIAFS